MKKALYAGSFDPITNGHLWLIHEASQIFDELIIGLGTNADKDYLFNNKERFVLIQELLQNYSNIKIMDLSNDLIVDYASNLGIRYLVRGIRNSTDLEFEQRVLNVNLDINSEVKTIFLIPPKEFSDISSNLIKGLVKSKNWEKIVKKYVPELVLEKLRNKV